MVAISMMRNRMGPMVAIDEEQDGKDDMLDRSSSKILKVQWMTSIGS